MEDLLSAFTFLTILPVGRLEAPESSGRMYAYFPVVGLIIGLVVSATASITFLPKELVACISLIVWVGLTGGLHLDGLADACDGLLATVCPERRLEIMKDPRAGSWAVIGIVCVLLGKWTAVKSLPAIALLLSPILGRWAMVLVCSAFPTAKSTGLAAQLRVGFGKTQLLIASFTTVAFTLLLSILLGWRALSLLILTPMVVGIVGRWAARRLGGGLTGDVYGAMCEIVELLCLVCLNIV